jgi:hypothetical protein
MALTEAFINHDEFEEFEEFIAAAAEADSERGDLEYDLSNIAFLAISGNPKLGQAVAGLPQGSR